ncbi:cysteine hydrolase family protein [Bradyrhizobium elkanii]
MVELVPDLAKFAPAARNFDKHVCSPWTGRDLHQQLCSDGIDTVIITGRETDVCVLATMLGAIEGVQRDQRITQLHAKPRAKFGLGTSSRVATACRPTVA